MSGASFHLENQLAYILLEDPQNNGNALTEDLLRALLGKLETWQNLCIEAAEEAPRALILRSMSPLAFSVGMDFQSFMAKQGTDEREGRAAELYRSCLQRIHQFPTPVICLLEKPARAGGVGLLMACDYVLACEEATISLGEALFGLIPANVLPYLRLRLSYRQANSMILKPSPIDAAQAYQLGLVDELPCSDFAALEKQLWQLLRAIFRCSPKALAEQKAFSEQIEGRELGLQAELAQQRLADLLTHPSVSEGIQGFLEGGLGPRAAKPSKSFVWQKIESKNER